MENQRLNKALSEKMCLLSASYNNDSNEWDFKMRGNTNNIYEQHLCSKTYTCSCPDHQGKQTFCKHLLFLVARVAKQYDLAGELAQRPKTTWKKSAFIACSTSFILCLSHLTNQTPTNITDDANDTCSICFEDLTNEIVECKTTCHKHFHKLCIDRWLEHGSTCPTCRSDWVKTSDLSISEISNTATVNIANVQTQVQVQLQGHTDIVISFDTTCSMYPCLAEVRRNTTALTERLFREIPSLRISIIAHGDYYSGKDVIKVLDFTTDQDVIKEFIKDAPKTYGGDYPECYELVLRTVKTLSWRPEATMKSLILIGDAPPHEKNNNPENIDWREETEALKNKNIQIFAVQCLYDGHNDDSFNFYSDIAEITNGYHVFLDQFSYIKDMLQAICFKQYNSDNLEKFEKEVQEGSGGMSHSMRLMFDIMLGKKTRQQVKEEMHPTRFKQRYSRSSGGTASANPSLEHENELCPSPPSRFQVFTVDTDMGIKDFCSKMGITFSIGRGFYEFTKPEIIQKKKEIVLMNKITKEIYEGNVARSIAGIGTNEENARIKPGQLAKYRMFVQSTSATRKLIGGQGFLYEA